MNVRSGDGFTTWRAWRRLRYSDGTWSTYLQRTRNIHLCVGLLKGWERALLLAAALATAAAAWYSVLNS